VQAAALQAAGRASAGQAAGLVIAAACASVASTRLPPCRRRTSETHRDAPSRERRAAPRRRILTTMTAAVRRLWQRHGIPRHALPWLIYLAALGFQPAFEPSDGVRAWTWVAVLVAAFLPVYAWTTRTIDRRPFLWRRGPGAVLGLIAIVTLGLVASPANTGATVFLVYASSLAGRVRPRRSAWILIALATVGVGVAGLLSDVPNPYRFVAFGPVLALTPILGMASVYEAERSRSNERLRMAQDEIERLAAVAERERIARDLHDLLGHTLSTVTLKAELAGRLLERDPTRASTEIEDVERISREALAEVRAAVRGYRSRGLQGELANAKLALEAAGVELDYFLPDLALRGEAEAVLALALREGVTNVVRHADAERCRVRLDRDGDWLLLEVEDDGVGLPDPASSDPDPGLYAMRQRVRALGGRVVLERSRAFERGGTRLELALPSARAIRDEVPA
jgi:two-component system sensor histidine kinase DesK